MSFYIEDDQSGLERFYKECEYLESHSIEIGVFGDDDSFYAMIANVHEFGMTIKPKNGKYLTIPTKAAEGRKARDIPGLFKPEGKNILAIQEGDSITVMFYLVKKVKIPERSFIRSTFDEQNDAWREHFERDFERMIEGEYDAHTVYIRLGGRIVGDIQKKIRNIKTPPNSPLTIENKGDNNPLIGSSLGGSGGLRQRITFRVVRAHDV